MADESLSTTPVAKERDSSRLHPSRIIIKIVEVILAIFIIGLMVDPLRDIQRKSIGFFRKMEDVSILFITVAGYLIFNLIFLIGNLIGEKIPKITSMMFSSLGCILHIVSGGLMVHLWRRGMGAYIDLQTNTIYSSKQYNDMLMSGSVFTFINAVVFAIDVYFTMKYA